MMNLMTNMMSPTCEGMEYSDTFQGVSDFDKTPKETNDERTSTVYFERAFANADSEKSAPVDLLSQSKVDNLREAIETQHMEGSGIIPFPGSD